MRGKNGRKASTLTELLIFMMIIAVVGIAAMGALWFALGVFMQTEEYTVMSAEMEFAVQRLSREFAMIGLGMPNNRLGLGSFAAAFAPPGTEPDLAPIMAMMGEVGAEWGGPLTVGAANPLDVYSSATLNGGVSVSSEDHEPGGKVFTGPELYYAWGVPTGVKAMAELNAEAENGDFVELTPLIPPKTGIAADSLLRDFVYDGRKIGFPDNITSQHHMNSAGWFLLPTLRIPLLLTALEPNVIRAQLAPHSSLPLSGSVTGLDEIHLLQVARIYLDAENAEMRQIVFGPNPHNPANNTMNVLARGILGLQFTYNPVSRLLTMYIAAHGQDHSPLGGGTGQPSSWPSWLPPLPKEFLKHRILVKTVTWRIRN